MDNKVLDEAVEVALTAYVNSRGSYEGEVPASSDDMRAALLAGVKVLLGEELAWQYRSKASEGAWITLSSKSVADVFAKHGLAIRALYAPSLGEGDGR